MGEVCPITKLEKILLTTDGSEFSEGAVKEALVLAGKCSSQVLAISVVQANEEYASEAPQLVEKAEAEASGVLTAVKARADEAGVGCDTEVHTGDSVYSIIINVAEKNGCELIVMGRRGRTGIARVAMGSVTAKVVGHAPCDVLVVPRECSLDFKTILVATDGSTHGDAAAAEAIAMAGKVGGSIIAMSVAASDSTAQTAADNVAKVKQMAEAAGISCDTRTSTGKAYVQIVETAGEEKADLIVIGCHGKGGLKKLLMGSVAERVIGHATCSVLVASCD